MLHAQSLSKLPGIRHGFFTRVGGVSQAPYAMLNCGPGSADAPGNIAENRARVALLTIAGFTSTPRIDTSHE